MAGKQNFAGKENFRANMLHCHAADDFASGYCNSGNVPCNNNLSVLRGGREDNCDSNHSASAHSDHDDKHNDTNHSSIAVRSNLREDSLTPREASFAGMSICTLRCASLDPEPTGCPSPGNGKRPDSDGVQFDQSQYAHGTHFTHESIAKVSSGAYVAAREEFLDEEPRVNGDLEDAADVPPIEAILKGCEEEGEREDEDMEFLPAHSPLVDLAYFYP